MANISCQRLWVSNSVSSRNQASNVSCARYSVVHTYAPFSRSKSKKNTFNAVLHLHASMPLRTLRLSVSDRIDHVFLHFRQIRHCKRLSFLIQNFFFRQNLFRAPDFGHSSIKYDKSEKIGWKVSRVRCRESGVGNRKSVVGNRKSVVGSRDGRMFLVKKWWSLFLVLMGMAGCRIYFLRSVPVFISNDFAIFPSKDQSDSFPTYAISFLTVSCCSYRNRCVLVHTFYNAVLHNYINRSFF